MRRGDRSAWPDRGPCPGEQPGPVLGSLY